MNRYHLAAVPIAVALGLGGAASASASPVSPQALACHASVSNARPADYTTVDVQVRTGTRARVVTVAHYRTTSHRKARSASAAGTARVPYYIDGATPGFAVKVSVNVSSGGRSGRCSTSFTPRR